MGEMSRLSESASECGHFVFFNQYEEEGFDEFFDYVLPAMNAEELRREQGPYSTLVTVDYEGHRLVLTSG